MILWRNIEIFLLFFILIPTPDFPHFYYMLGGNLGSLLYGDVSPQSTFLFSFHVEQSSFIQIVDMNRFYTGNPVSVRLIDYRKKS